MGNSPQNKTETTSKTHKMKVFALLSAFVTVVVADTVSFSSFQIGNGPLVHTSLGGHHEPTLHHHHDPMPHHVPTHHHAPVLHAPVHHHAPTHHAGVHHHAPVHHALVHHAPVHHASVHHAPVHHHTPIHHQPAQVYEPLGDVVDVAVGAGSFQTLVKIVSDLGLVDTLKSAEALTIFAPSDEAFAKLPEGTLESLTPEQAKAIVSRHVVTAKVPAASVTSGPVTTLGGEEITLIKNYQAVQISYNGGVSNVVKADVFASNGVIHVIDRVIL